MLTPKERKNLLKRLQNRFILIPKCCVLVKMEDVVNVLDEFVVEEVKDDKS